MTTTPSHPSHPTPATTAAVVHARAGSRTKAVWGVLLGAMTLVGGGLSLIDGGLSGIRPGATLSPLASLSGPGAVESVFRTNETIDDGAWSSIVIHHSGSPVGRPETIDEAHRAMGLSELGYHFVIGNGSGMGDGEIHVSRRWLDQLPGAHVSGPRSAEYNRVSIGICLVGNGDRRRFTDAQLASLADLVNALQSRLGLGSEDLRMHADLAPTTSPGALFPEAALRERLTP